MRIAVLLLLTTATVSAVSCQELRSQQPRWVASREAPSQTDSIGGLFRAALAAVAGASELPRLDSTTLLGGVGGRSASTTSAWASRIRSFAWCSTRTVSMASVAVLARGDLATRLLVA